MINSIQYVHAMYASSSGVAISSMCSEKNGEFENDFAQFEYMNITVVTSNKPYDSFCHVKGSKKGKCEDGYTKEVSGPEAVKIRVATKAKPNVDKNSPLDREFFKSFLKHGAPRNTDHPELRQPLAFEVWQSIKEQLGPSEKITILTNGPLTNVANILLSDSRATSVIESIYVVGGHISDESDSKGNVFTVPSNKYAEFNMYLDPLAAKTVMETTLDITLIPLSSQRKAASFQAILQALKHADHTPESSFV
ncbi:hypothetical protein PR202_gb01035 [Eleusine coracana subsp. coracana]|uniref:Inosine/uridine-preferring nucleoside hydrolase domain-containing protein n=1 Tax=Eleusine coracana subsp. coracana TaxID=191504 RepID=A0AAV5DUV2_ELECO|nr:hypothetical protein PR202_gb01035 [Eleusine coracana subsp. coracana]